MFISVKNLHNNMGVDETIARFFVDRKVPAENIFWKNRLLYITRGNGYISIPVYYDLLFRAGISKELLLDEGHIKFMEDVMHNAILVEYNEISFAAHLDKIKALLIGRIKNPAFYNVLVPYLAQPQIKPMGELGMPVTSLNRADVFLFILCDLPITKEQTSAAIKYWYALHTTYLLMDDIYDYKIDKQDNEENAVIELGDDEEGFDKAVDIVKSNIKVIHEINPRLSVHFEQWLETLPDLNT
jgi:hypothetical protein